MRGETFYQCQFCHELLPQTAFVEHDFPCWKRWDRQQGERDALAAGSRRAKTPKAVECEASQSGAKRNAQDRDTIND